jgi:hypothetical protein
MIREHESVILTEDLPKHGLKRGDIGVVVLLHGVAGYGVEFMTLDGETVAVVSLAKHQVRAVGPHKMAHSRPLEKHAP